MLVFLSASLAFHSDTFHINRTSELSWVKLFNWGISTRYLEWKIDFAASIMAYSTVTCCLCIHQILASYSFRLRASLFPRTPSSPFILIKLSGTVTEYVTLEAVQSTCWKRFLSKTPCVSSIASPRCRPGAHRETGLWISHTHTLVLMTLMKRAVIFCSWEYHSIT